MPALLNRLCLAGLGRRLSIKVLSIKVLSISVLSINVFSINVLSINVNAAQNDAAVLQRGEEVYRLTCATSYCHGQDGAKAGAPRLVSRGFDVDFIRDVISSGTEGTPMPGFAGALPEADLLAVMTYVAELNDIDNPVFFPEGGLGIAAPDTRKPLTGSAAAGRGLFFDAPRGVNRCSTCHQVEELGLPVAPPLTTIPDSVDQLKNLAQHNVQDLALSNESMPALVIASGQSGTLFYDLTSAPPVLRMLQPGVEFKLSEGSLWSHRDFLSAYSDTELQAVLDYLHAVSDRPQQN